MRVVGRAVLFLFVLLGYVQAENTTSHDNGKPLDYQELLREKLLSKYNKEIRPGVLRNGIKEQLKVYSTFAINRVLGSDDRLETMSVQMFFRQSWLDHRLTWIPLEYGNIRTIELDADDIWTPSTDLPNLQTFDPASVRQQFKVLVNLSTDPTGAPAAELTLITYALVQERCNFNMRYFPFDHQQCYICAGASSILDNEIYYETMEPAPYIFFEGGEWDLVDMSNRNLTGQWQFTCLAFTVQRRYIYYVINLLIPTVIVCVLNTIGLFSSIDAESDEMDYSTLGQTTLLALGVLMLTVADQTPKGSGEISLLGIFFLSMIFQTLLSALTAICLKKFIRHSNKISNRRFKSAEPAPIIRTIDLGHFIRRRGATICMFVHLGLVASITILALSIGYRNIRPKMQLKNWMDQM